MGAWRDLIGTVNTVFKIGLNKASLDAGALTAQRSFGLPDASGTLALKSEIVVQPPLSTLSNNAVATTETVVARWPLTAGYLTAAMVLNLSFMGQVSGTATLTFRVRIGTAGTAADTLAATFVTSAAGVANQHVFAELLIACLTAGATGTATAAGAVQFGAASLALVTAAFAAAAVNTTAALFVSVTLVQSAAQTYTSRAAALGRAN